MSELETTPFLILDCQTTGMRPSVGSLLEFCWAEGVTASSEMKVYGGLCELPAGADLPARVREITGIRLSDLAEGARACHEYRDEFSLAVISGSKFGARAPALVHYAQFEEAWVRDLLECEELPLEMFCTHRIASKLYPKVPSRNIRALSGFFGYRIGEIKRAAQHVQATQLIWQGLVPALAAVGVTTLDGLRAFMAEKPKKKAPAVASAKTSVEDRASYEYRVDRAKRLALPAKPGIYKMIAKSGEILYVGKATSLKDRVNSYFRGKKGRDPRKLEMMAQVWDLEVVECGSAIEAALVESDEIKRLNPPYNVSLKAGNRALLYYSRCLAKESLEPSLEFPVGPFRRFNAIEHLRLFTEGLRNDLVVNVFYQPIEPSILEEGYALFEEKYGNVDARTLREHLAFGIRLLRSGKDAEDTDADTVKAEVSQEEAGLNSETFSYPSPASESVSSPLDDDYTPADILEKIERLFMHAASTYLRAKQLTRLLRSDVRWSERGEVKSLNVRGGQLKGDLAMRLSKDTPAWRGLAISDYDRMSVLLMEISKIEHQIEALR